MQDSYFNKLINKLNFEIITLCLFVILVLVACIVPPVLKVVNEQTYVVTVQSKERVVINNSSKYLVYTTDSNGESYVFEITDGLFKWRFDSADTYNLIQVGETYAFTACGYRVPIISMYPNIYEMYLINVDSSDVALPEK